MSNAAEVRKAELALQERDALAYPYRCSAPLDAAPCLLCGEGVVEFSVPNDLWNAIVRRGGPETDQEYLCISCWYRKVRDFIDSHRSLTDLLNEMADLLRAINTCHVCKGTLLADHGEPPRCEDCTLEEYEEEDVIGVQADKLLAKYAALGQRREEKL